MNMVLSTLPVEGEYLSWATPPALDPHEVKHMPLGLLSLATNICSIVQPTILDPVADDWDIATTIQKINELNADVIGFTAVSRKVYSLYRLLEETKTCDTPYKGWKIVGGPHATYHAQEILDHGADTVFVGQLAEHELLKWCKCPVKGIIHCDSDINEISHPRRRIISDYEKYYFSGKVMFQSSRRMHMFTSVGCPNACNFCSVQSRHVQRKRADLVLGEMWHLKSLGAESIHFMDDNMNTSSKHVTGILDAMEATGWSLPWSMRGQVKFDLSLVPRMKKNGLARIHAGIEAFNDEALKWFGKNHRIKDIEKFCTMMSDNGVEILAYMVIGTPFDTDDYLDSLIEKFRKYKIQHPYTNVLYPMPDTSYYQSLLDDGTYKEDHWAKFMKNPTPGFIMPCPYGEDKKDKLYRCAEKIIKEFSGL